MDRLTSLDVSRLNFLQKVTPPTLTPLISDLRRKYSSAPSAKAIKTDDADPKLVQQLVLANEVADLTGEHADLTRAIAANPLGCADAKDVARNVSHGKMMELMDTSSTTDPAKSAAASGGDAIQASEPVLKLQRTLFHQYPNLVLARMTEHGELEVGLPEKEASTGTTHVISLVASSASTSQGSSGPTKQDVVDFLDTHADFDMRKTAVGVFIKEKGLQPHPQLVKALQTVQRTQALTHTPEALPGLSKAGLHSAFQIAQMPEKAFLKHMTDQVGGEKVARAIHNHAVNVSIRNDMALTSLLQAARGTGIAAIDGKTTKAARIDMAKKAASHQQEQVDLEKLFGSMDVCQCDDCNSVTSPASYFVELLQFLRNNNLDPSWQFGMDKTSLDASGLSTTGIKQIQSGTPLGVLFSRRPDLQKLELSCANTNVVLPYIDLANEVMESFIVNLGQSGTPSIEVFNMDSVNPEDSADLLTEPEYTIYVAYCILAKAVYPSTQLPFNQAVSAIRLFLQYLGTSRLELGKNFCGRYLPPTVTVTDSASSKKTSPTPPGGKKGNTSYGGSGSAWDDDDDDDDDDNGYGDVATPDTSTGETGTTTGTAISAENQAKLVKIHEQAVCRANDAEALLVTEEEYIILTKEAFWTKEHFAIRHGQDVSEQDYRTKIGVRQSWEYWGYANSTDMLDQSEANGALKLGLTFVKNAFLPRSGIAYADLVEMLQTQFINPNMLTGKDWIVMQAFRNSYKYLSSKVGKGTGKERFVPVVNALDSPAWRETLHKLGGKDVSDVMVLFDPPKHKDCCKHCGCRCRHHGSEPCDCIRRKRMLKWLCTNFDRMGKIIVLQSLLDELHLPWEAMLVQEPELDNTKVPPPPKLASSVGSEGAIVSKSTPSVVGVAEGEILIGRLQKDGTIVQWDGGPAPYGQQIGFLDHGGSVNATSAAPEKPWSSVYPRTTVKALDGTPLATITDASQFEMISKAPIPWTGFGDDCDIGKDRLRHLNGDSVSAEEYDNMQRFLRLWRKLGWTMMDLDNALQLLGRPKAKDSKPPSSSGSTLPAKTTPSGDTSTTDDVDWIDFASSCTDGQCGKDGCGHCGKNQDTSESTTPDKTCTSHCRHPKEPKPTVLPPPKISPDFLHQLVALQELSQLTGQDIAHLLTFWGPMTTAGTTDNPSLYSTLFLTTNLMAIDPVFKIDANGNYLASTPAPKISDHIPILLAAFQIRVRDFNDLMAVTPPIVDGGVGADLNLDNVTKIYRHILLGSILGVKPATVPMVNQTLSIDPFSGTDTALKLVKLWNKMSNAGFSFGQIYFVLNPTGLEANPLQPVGPSERSILQTAMTLYTELNDNDTQHPDITTITDATSAAVLQNAQLIYAANVTAQVGAFLDGTMLFQISDDVPTGLSISIPSNQTTLKTKLKYSDGTNPTLQITGQLTTDETQAAKALSANAKWAKAIDRCARLAATFLKNTLSGVFSDTELPTAKTKLLVGDVSSTDPTDPNSGTAGNKRLYFLSQFMPYLRRMLADKLTIDTLASATSLSESVCSVLLRGILVAPASDGSQAQVSALEALEQIKQDPAPPANAFTGYLIPPVTDTYTLVAKADSQPGDVLLDGQAISLSVHSDDDEPPDMWASQPLQLAGGRLYQIQLSFNSSLLEWKTQRTQMVAVPPSSLLADHVRGNLKGLFETLFKIAIVINGLSLTADEVTYFQNHASDFDGFDWNKFGLGVWERLVDYVNLRNSLPKMDMTLVQFFTWATWSKADATKLPYMINQVTVWEMADIAALISAPNFNLLAPTDFANERNFIKLQNALTVSTKVGMPINSLFDWAKPKIDFWTQHAIAESIKAAIRAKFKLSDFEVALKPTFDQLRQLQSNALTAYLINQPVLINGKPPVTDADSLFEFLLIDTQMCPCMETSRLKQATSSVQQFIQRCFLNLEGENGITPDMLDRGRWDWMQKYRLWEANRKVFLYPENWIQPSLRDDKSALYTQLESELMQKDLDQSSVTDIIQSFLFGLDAIANLEVDGIHVEDDEDPKSLPVQTVPKKIHVFARTRHSPYKFYYRAYDIKTMVWAPWQDMTVDIPRYEAEKDAKMPNGRGGARPTLAKPGGFYIVPFTFNSRLLVALPQITKVQLQAPVQAKKMTDIGSNDNATDSMPLEYWDIKMGLSEFRNGQWTPKQITGESINEGNDDQSKMPPLPSIGSYWFVARRHPATGANPGDYIGISIDCYRLWAPDTSASGDPVTNSNATVGFSVIGSFKFDGTHLGVDTNAPPNQPTKVPWSDFHFRVENITFENSQSPVSVRFMQPMQSDNANWDPSPFSSGTTVSYPTDETKRASQINYAGYGTGSQDPVHQPRVEQFYHPYVKKMLELMGETGDVGRVYKFLNGLGGGDWNDAFGAMPSDASQNLPVVYNELSHPYSIYNWEIGFHAPMAIADRLVQNQQFDLALKVMQYVFDPLTDSSDLKATRAWQWLPFQQTDATNVINAIFDSLRPDTVDPTVGGQINQWRDHPFSPHVIARLRPAAYMKYAVMKYINILIAYGDYYFNQNTLETIPMAIQCYVLASHIYGPPSAQVPKRGKKQVQTYATLLDTWDAFGNAMVQMEELFPFSINMIPSETGTVRTVSGLANIFGFAASTYFCVPDNPDLRALRATIDDRLFKIRHCEDINGVFRVLPLYEPPIDPGLLVAATAAGLSLSAVLSDLNSPLPNFKFHRLLERALQMCEQLRLFGKAFIRAKEKQDHEGLLELKERHTGVITGMVLDQKKLSKDESQKAVDALTQSRKAPEYRMTHTLKQLGEDLGQIPSIGDAEQEFKELADQIEAPIVDSGLKLISSEKEEIEKAIQSLDLKPIVNAIETVASELHVLPILNAHASPLGCGVAACWGPPNIARGVQGAAKAYQMVSDWLAHQGSNVTKRLGFVKQNQARVKEANTAGHEVKTVDKQILTHQVRLAVHDADIAAQQKASDNSDEVHQYLTSKYTSAQLYVWTQQQVSVLYYQGYKAAYDLAKKAEMAFRYERGLADTATPPPYISFGYWDPTHDGLLCGEKLALDLRALEAAHQASRGHDFEMAKHVSLRAINPLALLTLRGDGATPDFAIPEVLFDMDFPGHYARRLKSVAVSIRCDPAVSADPYFAQVNCTLRLLSNKFRTTPLVRGAADYPEKTDTEDLRFSVAAGVPITAIATTSAAADPGVFDADFSSRAERFLPFEGAGAASTWRLELNDAFRTFDYGAIQDVVLHLSYTSLDGGAALAAAAKGAVLAYIKDVADSEGGLFGVVDVVRDYPALFAAAKNGGAAERTFTLAGLNGLLPVYTRGTAPEKLTTADVYVVTDVDVPAGDVSVRVGGTVMSFSREGDAVGRSTLAMSALHWTDGPAVAIRDWVVTAGGSIAHVGEMLILMRYSMAV